MRADISESKVDDESKPESFKDGLKLFSDGDVNIKSIYSDRKSYDKVIKATNFKLIHTGGNYFHFKMILPEAAN